MVEARFDTGSNSARLVLRPNRSWTWRANLLLLASLMLVSGTVAVVLLLQGYWLVLPFTLLEQGILFACLWYCVRRTHRLEVLTLTAETVHLACGHQQPERHYRWPRFHTRVLVQAPRHPWYSPSVSLRGRQEQVEIGSFLSRADKEQLVANLRRFIHRLGDATAAPVD